MGIHDPQKDILGILFRPNRLSFAAKLHSSNKISGTMNELELKMQYGYEL